MSILADRLPQRRLVICAFLAAFEPVAKIVPVGNAFDVEIAPALFLGFVAIKRKVKQM